ncbi:MAG: signal peptidase I [Actinomycetota bacterium]
MSETTPVAPPEDADPETSDEAPPADEAPHARPKKSGRGRHRGKAKKKGFWASARELPILIILALGLALLIKTFLVQAFYIPSPSMEPTLTNGDRVLVDKLSYDFGTPHTGDVVVFRNPGFADEPDRNVIQGFLHWLVEGLGFAQAPDEDFIKRVIGEPGDTVRVDKDGVYVNDEQLDEPYIAENGGPTGTWTVPEDSVLVMGDNRANSTDSRAFGPIKIDSIVGKAFVIIWPPSRWGWL